MPTLCKKIYKDDILAGMENMKFYIVTGLLIIGAGLLGYGAIRSLRDPVYYVNKDTLTSVGDLSAGTPAAPAPDTTQVAQTTPADTAAPAVASDTSATATTPAPTTTTSTTTTTSKNADLIARLNKISGTLKVGSKGDGVKAVQEALNLVAKAGLPTNGTFGAQTEAAVKKFQTSAKISPATGAVASKTIAALVAKLK